MQFGLATEDLGTPARPSTPAGLPACSLAHPPLARPSHAPSPTTTTHPRTPPPIHMPTHAPPAQPARPPTQMPCYLPQEDNGAVGGSGTVTITLTPGFSFAKPVLYLRHDWLGQ